MHNLELILFPPNIIWWLLCFATLLVLFKKSLGYYLLIMGLGLQYILSIPMTAQYIFNYLQAYPIVYLNRIHPKVDAIMVLGGGRYRGAPEYGQDTVNRFSLERLRYGVWLANKTQLPLLIAGGHTCDCYKSEAFLMKQVAEQEFHTKVLDIETQSQTTWENAKYSVELLKQHQIQTVYLVSHAWHLPRAIYAFQQAGINVIPAPTMFYSSYVGGIYQGLPNGKAQAMIRLGLHELFGKLWYQLRY